MKKKIVCVLLSSLMCISLLSGCSKKVNEADTSTKEASTTKAASNEDAASSEKATVDILQFKVEIADELEKATKQYMESHKNVTINLETSSDYQADLKARMAGTDQPEIFCIDGPEHIKQWGDQLEDLSDQSWVSKVNQGLLGAVTTSDGKIYGLPMTIEGYGFIYNKEIFKAAGIDLENCKTYAQIDEAFSVLKKKIDNGDLADQFPTLEAVTEFPAGEKWVAGLHTSNVALSCEFNSAMDAYNADGIQFKYSDQFKKLIDLQVKYSANADDPSKLNSVDYATQVGGGLLVERVAVIQQGNWVSSEVKSTDPDFLNKLGMIAMPVDGVSEGKLPVGVPTNWAVNAKSSDADKKAAKDFLNWLYTSNEGKDIVVNKLNFIPIMSGYESYTVADPLGQIVQKYSSEGNVLNWVTSAYPAGWSDGVMGTEIQSYIASKESWDDVITKAKDQWSALKNK